jgi:mono/diheme cytochrome c family protein
MGINILWVRTVVVGSLLLVGCGSSGSSGLSIVASSGAELQGVAGDAIALKVEQGGADLPSGATVTWSGATHVTALAPTSTAASPLPPPGAEPTAAFVDNPGRPDRNADLAGVLFILDPGTEASPALKITATVSGSVSGTATVTIPVGPTPAGVASRGSTTYGSSGADCASCHGATAAGTPAQANGTFLIEGVSYPYPAPGLNTASGNLGSDPTWNAALLAMASRADMDNGGLTLREPMTDWLATPDPATSQPLTTQDFADIYAFLAAQSP